MKILAILTLLAFHLKIKAQSDTVPYRSFEVDTKSQKVVIYDRQSSIDMHAKPLMITNGGMFDPDYSPHGLLVCNHKVYKKLDTRTAKNANFYLQPNGVFVIQGGRYAVLSTKAFLEKYPILKDKSPDFASALFLDGAISEMFVGSQEEQKLAAYHFGPMIVVIKLK